MLSSSEDTKAIHGLYPEANRALFIKRIMRDMRNTNYAEIYFVDTKNGFSFSQNASGDLDEIKREVDLDKLGLVHGDVDINLDNTVNGRIVDYGGIMTKEFNKHLVKQQEELIAKKNRRNAAKISI